MTLLATDICGRPSPTSVRWAEHLVERARARVVAIPQAVTWDLYGEVLRALGTHAGHEIDLRAARWVLGQVRS